MLPISKRRKILKGRGNRLSERFGLNSGNKVGRDRLIVSGEDADSEGLEVIKSDGCKIGEYALLQMVPTNVGLECMQLVDQWSDERHSE